MAGFVKMMLAAEADLPWPEGRFLRVYRAIQGDSASMLLDGEPVADALIQLMDKEGVWEGTVKELLERLREYGPQEGRHTVT